MFLTIALLSLCSWVTEFLWPPPTSWLRSDMTSASSMSLSEVTLDVRPDTTPLLSLVMLVTVSARSAPRSASSPRSPTSFVGSLKTSSMRGWR